MNLLLEPAPNRTNWVYIFMRDRLWVLSTIIIILAAALCLITLMPRDYIAASIITTKHQNHINWSFEQQALLSEPVLNELQNQLFPVQSTRNFAGFRPLNLPDTLAKTPIKMAVKTNINPIIDKIKITKIVDAQNKAIGLTLQTRSTNPAEAMMLTRLITDIYIRTKQDDAAKQTAQQNAVIRTEILKKRKFLIDAETILAQYKNKHAAMIADAQTITKLRVGTVETTKADIAEMSLRYGPKHPIMLELTARLKMLETPINIDEDAGKSPAYLITQTMRQLTHDADIARTDLNQFLQKNGAGLSMGFDPNHNVITKGPISLRPDYNFDHSMIMWGLMMGALLGLSLVAIKQKLRPRLQIMADLPPAINALPAIGTITTAGTTTAINTAINAGTITVFKTMRHEIRLRLSDPKLLVITSDCDDALMPETALNFARTIAKTGEKIMIMDLNWVRPRLQQFAPNQKNRTLIDYLVGGASLEDILNRDDASNLHILYGGEVPMTGIDLLSAAKFSNLLLSFRQVYDLVILVAPPVAQGADARVLSKMADATWLTIIKDKSSLNGVKTAYSLLVESHIKSIATLWLD